VVWGHHGSDVSTILDSGALNISTWFALARGNGNGAVSSNLTSMAAPRSRPGNFSVGYNANTASTPTGSITSTGLRHSP